MSSLLAKALDITTFVLSKVILDLKYFKQYIISFFFLYTHNVFQVSFGIFMQGKILKLVL